MSSDTAKVLLGLAILLLASCRLVITTDETGHIVSASGLLDCDKSTCAFPITDKTTDTFTAVPAAGFRFVKWNSICASSPTALCAATVAPLPDNLKQFDGDIELSAVFEPTSKYRVWFRDEDGDHYGSADHRVEGRQQPQGFVMNRADCNDANRFIHPYTKELEDNIDNNCNGKIDEGFVDIRFFLDRDGDNYGDPNPGLSVMSRQRPDGYVRNKLDCNDWNAADNPEAGEVLDGRDNNCNGAIDEGSRDYYRDVDGDGFGTTGRAIQSLEPVEGYVRDDGDCDDNNASIFPWAKELFDGIDNDCDGTIDEGFTPQSCSLTAEEQSMLDAVNAVRAQARVCGSMGSYPAVPALTWNCQLEAAARGHSMDMANNNFFSHTGSNDQSVGYRATQAGYTWSSVGENIAAGIPLSTVSAVVAGWVDSPGHCANLMRSSYTELGAAKYSNSASTYNIYWTQVFGRPW